MFLIIVLYVPKKGAGPKGGFFFMLLMTQEGPEGVSSFCLCVKLFFMTQEGQRPGHESDTRSRKRAAWGGFAGDKMGEDHGQPRSLRRETHREGQRACLKTGAS